MTQIISLITKEHVFLASDRRLTYITGPNTGQVADDDTCKLVSLCNVCGIAYTGLAEINRTKTYEWIAKVLAEGKCREAAEASRLLASKATDAFKKYPVSRRRHAFLIVGWAYFENIEGLRSHFCLISNYLDESGQPLPNARNEFDLRVRALKEDEKFLWREVGVQIAGDRRRRVERTIRKLVSRNTGPKSVLRVLVDEVIYTAKINSTVGKKVLGLCIPRAAVLSQMSGGHTALLAKLPNDRVATFTYFDPSYSELQQYGPAFVCGEHAYIDLTTETDPDRNFQSSQVKIISLPKTNT
jgi:hypothetical protein